MRSAVGQIDAGMVRRIALTPRKVLIGRCLLASASVILVALFVWLISDIFFQGVSQLSWEFISENPRSSGRRGGIASILVATALIVLVCLVVAVPIGVLSGVFLNEYLPREGKLSNVFRLVLDILAGVPSIVFGLFGNAFFCVYLGMGFSILSGGLTLACMTLPLLVRASEAALRAVPVEYRHSGLALSLSRYRIFRSIILPAAFPGIVVAVVLSLCRALAETAALIFTSGYVDRMPRSLFDSGRSVSVHIYDLAMNVPGGNNNAYASALVLLIVLLGLLSALGMVATSRPQRRVGGAKECK